MIQPKFVGTNPGNMCAKCQKIRMKTREEIGFEEKVDNPDRQNDRQTNDTT